MPTLAAVTVALGMLSASGMVREATGRDEDQRQAQAQERARAWHSLLEADMSDQVLADAVRRIASGTVEVYGQARPADLNRAARAVRDERVRSWLERHERPTGRRNGFQQAAYLKGFLRAIGNGLEAVEADRHGRAAQAQAEQVAASEPGTPLPQVLERMARAVDAGRLPWAGSLPPARPVAEIGSSPAPSTSEGRERARAVVAALAAGRDTPRKAPESDSEPPSGSNRYPVWVTLLDPLIHAR